MKRRLRIAALTVVLAAMAGSLALACGDDDDDDLSPGEAQARLCDDLATFGNALETVRNVDPQTITIDQFQGLVDDAQSAWDAVEESAEQLEEVRLEPLREAQDDLEEAVAEVDDDETLSQAQPQIQAQAEAVVTARQEVETGLACPPAAATGTAVPTEPAQPTEAPAEPTEEPTGAPTDEPTEEPTDEPTEEPTEPGTTPTETVVFEPGTPVIINSPSGCVNLREAPTTEFDNIIACLDHGLGLTIVEGPTEAEGIDWYLVDTPEGQGYVSSEFLQVAGE
jgi:PT repeat